MQRFVKVYYSGNCPDCGAYESSKKPEHVDVLCWRCEAKKGNILSIKPIEGYDLDDIATEIQIETEDNIIVIRAYTPEVIVNKKEK